ncbi:MAG: hypothetical protein Q7J13_10435 [Brevundimonas sp.]|uniref:hypothetical protein n=1 Tax=Brevundimonas sp. TaxID=1871086 RepID=UPI002727288F|nr:hypothetical protein [Brevundimonas sp.]MDO9588338.1 hypothetical protein [Brevundimonas sp.]
MKRKVSTGLMAVYWVALPLSALVTLGLGLLFVMPGAQTITGPPAGLSVLLSLAVTLLIAWRLWTHGRARRLASRTAEASRDNDD